MKKRKPKQRTYDSSLFPIFESGHTLPPKMKFRRKKFPELHDCLSASIYMANQIELIEEGSIHLRIDKLRSIYLRASLNELCRAEDFCDSQNEPFKFQDSNDPLLHMLKLLRNYHVHLSSNELSEGTTLVKWGEDEVVYNSFIIDNLHHEDLRKLSYYSVGGYTDEQLIKLVELFETAQRQFGIVQLLYNATLHVQKLVTQHLQKQNQKRNI